MQVFGQTEKPDTLARINKKYILSYWHDTKKTIVSPITWKAKEWSTFAGVAGITAVTFAYDQEIYDFASRQQSQSASEISKYVIEPWGSGLYSLPLLAGIYIAGRNNNHHRTVALTGLKAFIVAGEAAVVFKHLFHRHRPYENQPADSWIWDGPIPLTFDHTSFPSGHTTTAFAVASVLACGYKDKPWIGISAYTVAGLVGLSRVYEQKHWASDVLVGAALGTFIGTSFSRLNFSKLQVGPSAMRGGYGVRIVYQL